MPNTEKREIRIAVAVLDQPDGTFVLTNDFGLPSEEVKSIDDALEIVDVWAKMRLEKDDAKDAKIVVDFSYPVLTFH
ncbi:hypothetical protein P245_19835 [Comamonas thiooxydans]|uniref:DUF1902 domain-containing protein n=1 Tax=Comamonas thiooxydans TaxID=363952 RepID=A0A0E3BCL4_9BURK|nr:hypothetical protein [Comamonas thiooxydans]KGG87705.1 hypothetical protein P245_19835 [Comamonas thiooxydans]